jgi:hypothetical protein
LASISRAKTTRPAGGSTPTLSSSRSAIAATRRRRPFARGLHGAARLRALPRRAAPARGGDDPLAHGELFADWWTNAGYEESGYDYVFYHDVPRALAAEAKRRERGEDSKALREPWPLETWPDVPTRYVLCRDDRMFPAAWARRHARERLDLEADEMDGGHYITLSRPRELAERLMAYAASVR